jgi:hypothetical protein
LVWVATGDVPLGLGWAELGWINQIVSAARVTVPTAAPASSVRRMALFLPKDKEHPPFSYNRTVPQVL